MTDRRAFLQGMAGAASVPFLPRGAFASGSRFPLAVSRDGHVLVDRAGLPFLVNGDAAWSLIAELKREEIELYLADRQRRGFNAILVNLVEHRFATRAPANAYGESPFDGAAFTRPDPRYFDRARWAVERARERGILVLLAPAYAGINGDSEGWYQEMRAAGPEVLRSYGRYLDERFAGLDNIVWVHGGDWDVPEKDLVLSIVRGLGPEWLHTVHSNPESVTRDYWPHASWLAIDTVYTYGDVHRKTAQATSTAPPMPALMIESAYENERGSTEATLRRAAYGAVLGGAAGHVFGNNPIWHFSGSGLYETGMTWQQELASRGAQSMTHFKAFFDAVNWWQIVPVLDPDPERRVVSGVGVVDLVYTAVAADRSFALAYLDDVPSVVVRLDAAGAARAQARWFDPSSGSWIEAHGEAGARSLLVAPPALENAAGFADWVLLVRFRE